MSFDPPARSSARLLSVDNLLTMPIEEVLTVCRPTRDDNRKISATLEGVLDALRDLKPARILNGGSFGKGTHIKGKDEAALLLLFSGLRPEHEAVQAKLSAMKSVLSNVCELTVTGNSLKTVINGVELTVRPAPFLGDEADHFECIAAAPELRQQYYGDQSMLGATAYQVEFMKHQDARYKDFARYCKVWRDAHHEWPDGSRPRDGLIELLSLAAYEQASVRTGKFFLR